MVVPVRLWLRRCGITFSADQLWPECRDLAVGHVADVPSQAEGIADAEALDQHLPSLLAHFISDEPHGDVAAVDQILPGRC